MAHLNDGKSKSYEIPRMSNPGAFVWCSAGAAQPGRRKKKAPDSRWAIGGGEGHMIAKGAGETACILIAGRFGIPPLPAPQHTAPMLVSPAARVRPAAG